VSEINDDDDIDRPSEDEGVDLEWDDALADWEDEVESSAQAKSTPMPQSAKEPARALYRPPSPDEFARGAAPRPAPAKPAPPPLADFDDDEFESTRIAAIPQELINSLVAKEKRERQNEQPTRPPPPSKAAVDLDLDGLLDGFDEPKPARPVPTVGGAAEAAPLPRPAPASPDVVASFASGPDWDDDEDDEPRTRIAAPLPKPAVKPPAPATSPDDDDEDDEPRTRIAAPLPKPPAPAPSFDDDEDDEPRTRIAAPLPRPAAAVDEEARTRFAAPLPDAEDDEDEPQTRIAAPLADDEDEPQTRIAAPLPRPSADEEARTRIAAPAQALEFDDEDGPTMELPVEPAAKPAAPKLPAVPAIPRPPVPPPAGARPAIPKPGLPPLPPAGAKPGIPKPPLPAIPKPGGAPAVPRVPGPPRPGGAVVPPPPGLGVPRPPAPPPKPTAHEEDDDLDALLALGPAGAPKPAAPSVPKPGADVRPSQPEDSAEAAIELAEEVVEEAVAEPEELSVTPSVPEPAAAVVAPPAAEEPSRGEPVQPAPEVLAEEPVLAPTEDEPTDDEPALAAEPAIDEPTAEPAVEDDEPAIAAEPTDDEPVFTAEADDEPAAAEAADDEEPAIEAGASDEEPEASLDAEDDGVSIGADDEEGVSIGADDDGEMAVEADGEMAVEADGEMAVEADDEDEEDWEALEAEADAQAAAAKVAADRGALAARRSVRSRKPRDEVFPMVGDGPDALRLRQRVLETLAKPREGGVRARLLVGAAELAEQLGETDRARELYVGALEADPTDVVALRALRRDALARAAWSELAELFAREAELALAPRERALALTGLAELQLARQSDPEAAAATAARALELDPRSVAARVLLTEARLARGEITPALDALAPTAERWDDARAQAMVHLAVARHAERRGETEHARKTYQAAAELDEDALDALVGLARTATREDPRTAVAALASVADRTSGIVRDALRTRASRIATQSGDAATGVALLADVTGTVPLRARAEAASATGDGKLERSALAAWAGAAGGTERALALVRMAETLAQDGDMDAAEAALRDAALADGSLGLVRVVREVLARRSGDVSRLLDQVEAGGALAAAARIATAGEPERERELLGAAVDEGNALVAADVLGLDVAAALGDDDALTEALRRQADRTAPEVRTGALLALADRALARGDADTARALLHEARGLAPGQAVILRPLGRLASQDDALGAAAAWLEEAASSAGARAAYCATEAARLLLRAGGDALGALRRAVEAERGYGPAAWLAKPAAVEAGDAATLGEVHEQLAETAALPSDGAGHRLRAALLRAEADPDGAAQLLARAREAVPDDAVLQSLSLRVSGGSALDRASMLRDSADKASPALQRVLRLQAAAAYEDAGEPATAAALYRAVAETHPDDPVVRVGLDRAELAAGEVARVAERRFQAVKDATHEEHRVSALERLADLDLYERGDPASAVLSLQSILEVAPGHLPSLRALQRYFTEQGRVEDAANVVEALAEHLEAGADVTSHLRLARRLRLASPEAAGEAADAMLLRLVARAELDLWLAPRVLGAARANDDLPTAQNAARRIAELLSGANERASARLRAAELLQGTPSALELLQGATQSAPLHPVAAQSLAEAAEEVERWAEAAQAWEEAGRASEVRARAAAFFLRAGRLWEERLGDREKALKAYELATMRDVGHADAFQRYAALLEAAGDKARLAELYGLRVAAGGDDATLIALYLEQGRLHRELRDLTNAKTALRAALALAPERVDALRGLADLCLEDEDWRGAAEVLIRIARVRKEREELRWVFFTLGDIYDRHMPDPQRAEAAFKRVLKLLPEDVPAMERLAALYQREGQHANAAEVLTELARLDVDPDRNRTHRLELAATYEQLGDARKAEQVLEDARRAAPTDLVILRGMAELYRRQSATNAMGMHLSRAVNDFRHALEADLGDAAAWPGLVEVLHWRGDADAAAAAASAAQALGIVDLEMSKCVDARGSAPPLGAGAALEVLDELLAPGHLPAPTRAVFRLAGEALERSLQFDVAAYRAEKINPRDTLIRPIALEVGRWFGIPEPQIFVTSAAPRVCVPVYSNPVTVLIGSELLGITDDREKVFVLVRALKIAHAQLSVVVRAQPNELLALLGGLLQSYDPRHVAPGADPGLVAEAGRRIAKNLARKTRDELEPLVLEMAGRPGYDPSRFAMAASEWGNRTALVASGSAPAGFAALAKLSGERELPADPNARLAMLQRFPEAASLLAFAISDAHFQARRRAAGR
jgi:lipopolysaccharide biosynthesis regulator YciM